jgi:uncharacterized membrane protein
VIAATRLSLLWTYGAGGVLLALLAVPMIKGRVPRNRIYGFRTPKTLSSDRVWYAANRIAGWDLLLAGTGMAIGAAALFVFGGALSPRLLALAHGALMVVALGAATAHSFLALRKL